MLGVRAISAMGDRLTSLRMFRRQREACQRTRGTASYTRSALRYSDPERRTYLSMKIQILRISVILSLIHDFHEKGFRVSVRRVITPEITARAAATIRRWTARDAAERY
jgi:hypothetical protein